MAAPAEAGKEVIGLYPGSFDPIHIGHVNIAERAARGLDRLFMGIAINPAKKPLFSVDERKELIEASLGHIDEFAGVISFDEGLTVDHARELGATMMIRGDRSVDDFLEEVKLFNQNVHVQTSVGIDSGSAEFVDTQTFHTLPGFEQAESSLVRGLMGMNGVALRAERIQSLVPAPVFEAILPRLPENR